MLRKVKKTPFGNINKNWHHEVIAEFNKRETLVKEFGHSRPIQIEILESQLTKLKELYGELEEPKLVEKFLTEKLMALIRERYCPDCKKKTEHHNGGCQPCEKKAPQVQKTESQQAQGKKPK